MTKEQEIQSVWDKVTDSKDYVSIALERGRWSVSEAICWARRMQKDLAEFVDLLEKTHP